MLDCVIHSKSFCGAAGATFALWLSALLCGCTPSADEVKARHDTSGTPAAAVASGMSGATTAGARDAELVMAVALSKAKLPIEVRFRLEAKPVVGQPVKFELVVTPLQLAQIRGLRLRLQTGAELLLQSEAELTMDSMSPGEPLRHEVVVVPQSSGVLELEISAALETNSDSLSQTYAIPLVVQTPANPG
jgi:hypothetical protein